MKAKQKPCKAIGKAKASDFQGCGEMVWQRTYGLGHSCGCYGDWLLNTPEGQEKINGAVQKATQPRRELQKAREESKSNKSIQWLLINTRTYCHDYIKLRDRGKPCVSCDQPWHSDHQAGHWKKAELYSTLRFDETNIHNQCEGCNIGKDGNVQQYADRITLRISQEQKDRIEHLAAEEKKGHHKWDRQELIEIREYYKKKIKELKEI